MSGASKDFLRIARVLKSYGTDGEVLMGFREVGPEDLDLKEPVFIMFDGLPVPFFIEYSSAKGPSRILASLTGVRSLEDAEELVGSDVYVRAENLEVGDEDELTAEDLVGWTLKDEYGATIGTVTGFEPIPGNPCLYVDHEGDVIMVPLHDDLIVRIDSGGQKISLRIPEGLI